MLYKVEARTPRGDLLTLPLDDISGGYIVADIQGLDPIKATVTTTKFANARGAAYQSSTLPERNIILSLEYDKFHEDTVEVLRNRLYPFFMSMQEVRLRFYMTSGLTVDIDGYSESMDSPLFVQDPKVDISIICPLPDFIATTPTVISGMSTSNTSARTVTYDGNAPVGMVFRVAVAATTTDITFYHTTPDGNLYSMEFSGSLIAGDVLTISTIEGDKYAILTRAGVESSVLYGISPQSKWLELTHGDNLIRAYATSSPGSPVTITYTGKYGGL
jgi:hypothetical protein